MECKSEAEYECRTAHKELIDTLWNVNHADGMTDDELAEELIDTLWNVNRTGNSRKNLSHH